MNAVASFARRAALHVYAPRGIPRDGAVVLLHGACGSGRHWAPVLSMLDPRIRPLVLDLPGHGRSGGTVPSTLEGGVAAILETLDGLGVDQVDVVGHSIGGLLAQGLALMLPQRVRRLALVATAAKLQLHPSFLAQLRTGVWDQAFLDGSFAAEVPRVARDVVLRDFTRGPFLWNGEDFFGAAATDLSPRLGGIRAKTLVLSPGEDAVVSPRRTLLLARQIPDAAVVPVPGAGHYVHVERPADVAGALDAFLLAEPAS